MGKRVLGLDLGPNSIGWAIIDEGSGKNDAFLVDVGVRVFTEGVDAYDSAKEKSRNEARRTARGMRRQTKRRVRRRERLIQGLVECGLFPADPQEQQMLLSKDPYDLRSRAIDPNSRLSLYEVGRVFLHLSRRRGFLSNRKTDKPTKESEGLLHEIQQNEAERVASGEKTLGAWLKKKLDVFDHKNRVQGDHVRKRHLSRSQYMDEFSKIWETQQKLYPDVFTDVLRFGLLADAAYPCLPQKRQSSDQSLLQLYGIFGLIFFQRRMYWKASTIGRCELEPKQKRCPIADRRFQLFRILQEVNNLRYIDTDSKNESTLNEIQRLKLVSKLQTTEKLEFNQIRKLLRFPDSVRFNLERGERGQIKGNRTDAILGSKKVLGDKWSLLDEEIKNAIVSSLLDPNTDEINFVSKAKTEWRLDDLEIAALLSAPVPTGYGNLSLKAIDKLLPFLQQGMIYSASNPEGSALHAAGYLRRDQLRRRLFDYLPDPQRRKNTPIGSIPNPVVKRTLCEVRKLVNAIIREFGKPDEIHVEMARDLQMGKLKRDEYSKTIRERERNREHITEILIENNQRPSRENILRYQLWLEQKHECLYTGRPISQAQLWGEGGGVEIDHILPRSRTLDNSQANKVLCFREANGEKGDRTPFEWLGNSQPDRFEAITSRAMHLVKDGKMAFFKYRKIVQKELQNDDFVAKQLVDTAYITKATAEYLRCLFEADHHVLGLKGRLTAELRWQWGVESVLAELPDSPAWVENAKLRAGEKNRADHRHHAIDAIIIALTSRSRLQELANFLKPHSRRGGELLDPPWSSFRDDVKKRIKSVWVSHKVERKVSGALHEETQYGATELENIWVTRKPIESLSANEIESIRDPEIKRIVIAALAKAGVEYGRGKKLDAKKFNEAVTGLKMPSGVPIRKVRVTKPEQTIRPIRISKSKTYVKPGSTHHLCIFEKRIGNKTKREAVFVTMLEALHRIRRREQVIDRIGLDPEAKFIMSLSSREMVLTQVENETRLLLFKTAASTQGQIYLAEHTDARRSSEYRKFVFTANTLRGRKVTVDLLGRIRDAND